MGCNAAIDGVSLEKEQQRIASQTDAPILKSWDVYMVCKKDTDCMIASGVCGRPAVINKRKLGQFSKAMSRLHRSIKCSWPPPEYDPSKVSTFCEGSFCAFSGYEEQLPPNSR